MAAKNLRQFEFKLGKLGLILFIIGLSILVFAGFLLGVQVGRNIDTYPEMIARGIPGKILGSLGLSAPDIRTDIPAAASGGAQESASSGESKAGKASEGENVAAVIMAPQAPKDMTPEPKETSPPVPEAKSPAAPPVAAPVVPAAPAPAKERTPSVAAAPVVKPPPPPVEQKKDVAASDKNGKYTVQVVSFREKEKADGLGRKIKELGYAPNVAMTDVPGKGQWYRVTVNSFATKQAAEKAADDLTKKIKGVSCVIKSK